MSTTPTPTGAPTTRSRRMRRTGAALALAAGAAAVGLWSAPASALVTEADEFTILSVGYDVGNLDESFTNGRPDNPAVVTWDHAWFGVVPSVDGVMHYESVSGECTRVRLIAFDDDGTSLGSDYSDRKCANTAGHETRPIVEGNFPLSGRPGAASVQVILQHETPNGWARVGAIQEADYGPIIDTDNAVIRREQLDFGNGDYDVATLGPEDPGQIIWNSSGGAIRPSVLGNLYMDDASDLCGRVRVRFLDVDGDELDRRFSPELCVSDDDVHEMYVQVSDFTHNSVDDVQITLQKKGGTGVWENVGSTTKQLN